MLFSCRGDAKIAEMYFIFSLSVVVKKVVAFFYKFLSSIISKKIVLWLTSLVESSSTSHPANFSLVPPGP